MEYDVLYVAVITKKNSHNRIREKKIIKMLRLDIRKHFDLHILCKYSTLKTIQKCSEFEGGIL